MVRLTPVYDTFDDIIVKKNSVIYIVIKLNK